MNALKHTLVSTAGALWRKVSPDRLITPGGEVFDISPDMDDYNRFALFAGRYEKFELKLLKDFFQEDDTIIEIGANIGVVARYAFLNRLKNRGIYICVEPNPNSRAALEANMRRAQTKFPDKKFRVIGAAVSGPSRNGQSDDFVMRRNLGSALSNHIKMTGDETIVKVPNRSLGDLMQEFAPRGASLICDTEGGEIPMILEDAASFAGIRQMVIELHGPELTGRSETPEQMLDRLQQMGFAVGGACDNCFYLSRQK